MAARLMGMLMLTTLWGVGSAPAAETAAAPNASLLPWSAGKHASDVPKQHVEAVEVARHEYLVRQGGTMDGANCRSPMGTYETYEQTWESNRSVRLENIGAADIVNPWLSNGRNNFRTMAEIISSAVKPGMNDREKALALYHQEIAHRWHWAGDNNELIEPVKVFNIYGYNTCGNDSICLAGLWTRAGLKVAPAHTVGHCISQVFFDDRWNLLDGDMQCVYLLRDGKRYASEADLVHDHDLIKRAHTQGILRPAGRGGDEWEAALFVYDGPVEGARNSGDKHTMNMTLRPGEAIVWRWGYADSLKIQGKAPKFNHTVCNGLWEYRPDFTHDTWRSGAAKIEAVKATPEGLEVDSAQNGSIEWNVQCPYLFVGGRLEHESHGVTFQLSFDGQKWEAVESSLDKHFGGSNPPRYTYRLRANLQAGARLKRLSIFNDLQMAPLALPSMRVGENKFVYTDECQGPRKVRITHDWIERSATRPPAAPAGPEYPAGGGESDGTQIVFKWKPAADADGDAIADYHFELSEYADMRWPLSTNFARLISRTSDRGKAQYTLTAPGLLAVETAYYWRVRAKDAHGVWGPWSDTWTFIARGPGCPTDVKLEFDSAREIGTLRWKAPAVGRKPVKYRVYGSDEKGFSVSDEPYSVNLGNQKSSLPKTFAANFAVEVEGFECAVVGRNLKIANANKAYYRIVAVDEAGSRSVPSEYVSAPRGFVASSYPAQAKVGQLWSYKPEAIRSIGDLRSRNGLAMKHWDVEQVHFATVGAPAWLKLDPANGTLSGTPDAAGRVEFELKATVQVERRTLDPKALAWGNEKVTATATEDVGQGTQKLVVEVAP